MGFYIPGNFPCSKNKFSSSVYVVVSYGECILVDAGMGKSVLNDIIALIDGMDLTLKWIVLTHDHYDHVANAPKLRSYFEAPVLVGQEDRIIAENPLFIFNDELMCHQFGISMRKSYQQINLSAEEIAKKCRHIKNMDYHPFSTDDCVRDGDILSLKNLDVHIIETPGHSPGSISVWIPDHGAVFAGDLPVWMGTVRPYPVGDYSAWKKSMRRLIDHDMRIVGWGHGVITTGSERCTRFLRHTLERAERLLFNMMSIIEQHGVIYVGDLMKAMCEQNKAPERILMDSLHSMIHHLCDRSIIDLFEGYDGRYRVKMG